MHRLNRIIRIAKNLASPLATVISLAISMISLYVAYDGIKSTNEISAQALATARQANEIALGRTREPALLQFSAYSTASYDFDFLSPKELERELHLYVNLHNDGKKPVEGAVIEVVGIRPLTYKLYEPSNGIDELPAVIYSTSFNSAVQPGGSVHLDIRKLILQYLVKLGPKIQDKDAIYRTVVNVVVTAKGLGEPVAVGAPIKDSPRDRQLFTIQFRARILDSEIARKILADPYAPNRVFSP